MERCVNVWSIYPEENCLIEMKRAAMTIRIRGVIVSDGRMCE